MSRRLSARFLGRCGSVLLLLVLLPIRAPILWAQEAPPPDEDLPVRLKADVFRYDRRTRVLTATGNVVLTVDDVTIHADALVANLATGQVNAEGAVRLEVGGQAVSGDVLEYNLTTRIGTLYRAQSTYSGPLVLGTVTLRAQRLEGDPPRFLTGRGTFATTCDPEDPFVSFTADEISILVGDKIVGRRVSMWIGDRRLFTIPYFIIFLRERREARIAPVVGYSDPEGWFVKTSYAYFINNAHYGFVHADWMERLGQGFGVEHLYQVKGGGGSALVYRLANRQTGGADLRSVVSHVQQVSESTRASAFLDYFGRTFVSVPDTSLTFAAFDLNRRLPNASTSLFALFDRSTTTGLIQTSFMAGTLVHNQRLGSNLGADAIFQFTRSSSAIGTDDELTPRFALAYTGSSLSASLVMETRWDLDADRFTGDARYSLDRLPELTVALRPFRLGGTTLIAQIEGAVGRFRETTVGVGGRTLDAVRTDLLTTVTGPLRIGDRGLLSVRAFARASRYTTGDSRVYYGGRLEYLHPFGSAVEARVGYTGQAVSGNSPYLFDQIFGTVSAADAALSYRNSRLFVNGGISYDFATRRMGQLTARAIYLPPSGWSVGAAAAYDVGQGRLDRLEANVDLQLSKEWRVQYAGFYDGISGRVVHDRVSVIRVFCDCLGVSLTYLGVRNEFWLEAWLTAIPWGRGRIGMGGRGNLLFDQPYPITPRP